MKTIAEEASWYCCPCLSDIHGFLKPTSAVVYCLRTLDDPRVFEFMHARSSLAANGVWVMTEDLIVNIYRDLGNLARDFA